jgi:hypothetical protein
VKKEACEKCGGTNTYYTEIHPDTGMDEIVLRCRDCARKIKRLPLRFRAREWVEIRFNRVWSRVVSRLFRLARWAARKGGYRCTWCGAMPGFNSSISRKGLRCQTLERDCTKQP